MRTLVLILLSLCIKGQQWPGCNHSGHTPGIIVPPFSTVNFSLGATANQTVYLCGPNTVAYDTLGAGFAVGPDVVLVDSGATYISKESDNLTPFCIVVKNWGTLILLLNPDSFAFPTSLYVSQEPFATVINNSGFGFQNTNCPTISFPNINCGTSTNLAFITSKNSINKLETFPNPVNDYLTLTLDSDFNEKSYLVYLYNSQGILLRQEYIQFENNTSRIITSSLEPGFYIIQLNSLDGLSVQRRFIVNR